MISEKNKKIIIEYIKSSRLTFYRIWQIVAKNGEFSYEEMMQFYSEYTSKYGEIKRPDRKGVKLEDLNFDDIILSMVEDGKSVKEIAVELKKKDHRINELYVDKRCEELGIIEQLYVQQIDDRYDELFVELAARGYNRYMQICTYIKDNYGETLSQKVVKYRRAYALKKYDYRSHPLYIQLLKLIENEIMQGHNRNQIARAIRLQGYNYEKEKLDEIINGLKNGNEKLKRASVVRIDGLIGIEEVFSMYNDDKMTFDEIAKEINSKHGSNINPTYIEGKIRAHMTELNRQKKVREAGFNEKNKLSDYSDEIRHEEYGDIIIDLRIRGYGLIEIDSLFKSCGIKVSKNDIKYIYDDYKKCYDVKEHPTYTYIISTIHNLANQGFSVEDIKYKLKGLNIIVSYNVLANYVRAINVEKNGYKSITERMALVEGHQENENNPFIKLFKSIMKKRNLSPNQIMKIAEQHEINIKLKDLIEIERS